MGSLVLSAQSRTELLADWQSIYDSHKYLDAYIASAAFWSASTPVQELSGKELVFAARLASRLGGLRLSRYLYREAHIRDPSSPLVRYFTRHLDGSRQFLLDDLVAFQKDPEVGGDEADVRASWQAAYAYSFATLRDFGRANDLLKTAHDICPNSAWILSQEADILGMADRWQDSLAVAKEGCRVDPASPWPISSLTTALLHLGEIEEAVSRISRAAETSQYYRVLQSACWYHCALAETLDGEERRSVLEAAGRWAERCAAMMPLVDRECRADLARTWLDLASMQDDHAGMERWSGEVRSPFYRKVLANLRLNPEGRRLRLPYRRTIQKYVECVPTSISTAVSSMGVHIPLEEFAREVTFGGTYEWAAADWLRERELYVRFFSVNAETATQLIEAGIGFTLTWDDDDSGHCVAVVGADLAAGTLLVHDPNSFRSTEYLLSSLRDDYSPIGILGMAAVPSTHKAKLDAILPPGSALADASVSQHRLFVREGAAAAATIVDECEAQYPDHPGAAFLRAIQNLEEGKAGRAHHGFGELLAQFPESAAVRVRWISSCRALGDTALLRSTLRSIVERGKAPGIDSQKAWTSPHPRYVQEYADLLRLSAETRSKAETLLRISLRDNWRSANGWHILADLRWVQGATESALLAYRLASTLAEHNEHYAKAYADVLHRGGRTSEALQWLESRAHELGTSAHAISTWVTYISALEDWGQPDEALKVCRNALERFADSSELLTFAIPFFARMAQWQEAERWFDALQAMGGDAQRHEAAVYFFQMRGLTKNALESAEAWVLAAPLSLTARRKFLSLTTRVHGSMAALGKAAEWMQERPENDHFEELYCEQDDLPVWRKLRVLKLRLQRNPDDAWAWRELAFTSISHFQTADARHRERVKPRIVMYLNEAQRLSATDAATLRGVGLWQEVQQETQNASVSYLESIRLEPGYFWPYRRLFQLSSQSSAEEQHALWADIEALWLTNVGDLPNCLEMMRQLNDLFGPLKTEEIITEWRKSRPNDAGLIEATADLLLDFGNGRADAKRAVDLLRETIEQYPYNSGLRYSMARAWRMAGDDAAAGKVYEELVSHRPDDLSARIELARIRERAGCAEEALEILQAAAEIEPQDYAPLDARAQILIDNARYDEAVSVVEDSLCTLTRSVRLYERSIALLAECGQGQKAVEAARQGVRAYPDGAYLWLLLGKALRQHGQFAAPGEIELCLRKSLQLNPGLYETADILAILLSEQRRYEDAYRVLLDVEQHITDPSSALGRRAWVKRQAGETQEALNELANLVQRFPNYPWGWNLLLEWLQQDKAWDLCKKLIDPLPPSMQSDAAFRRNRLSALQKAGQPPVALDPAWLQLLDDFPEDLPLHLLRYDALRDARRWEEARDTLDRVGHRQDENVYLMARLVDVSAHDKRFDDAMAYALKVCFAPIEESPWPVDRTWDVLRDHHHENRLADTFRQRLVEGAQPTRRALMRYAQHLIGPALTGSSAIKWLRQTPLHHTTRQIRSLMGTVFSSPWNNGGYVADMFCILNTGKYTRLVIRFWRNLRDRPLENDTAAWAEAGRAMIDGKRYRSARSLFQDWRSRRGVRMWSIANYMLSLPRFRNRDLQEVIATCKDALNDLAHDHCASYLAHMQAEACALAGDKQGLREVWEARRGYFSATPKEGEYFRKRDEHLRHNIPDLLKALQQDNGKVYRTLVWKVRLKRLRPIREGALRMFLGMAAILWALGIASIALSS